MSYYHIRKSNVGLVSRIRGIVARRSLSAIQALWLTFNILRLPEPTLWCTINCVFLSASCMLEWIIIKKSIINLKAIYSAVEMNKEKQQQQEQQRDDLFIESFSRSAPMYFGVTLLYRSIGNTTKIKRTRM